MEMKMLSCPLCMKPHFEGVDALRATLISVATSHLSCPVCSESLLGLDKLTIHLFSHITNSTQEPCLSPTFVPSEKNSIQPNANKNYSKCQTESLDCKDNSTVNCIRCDICNFCFNDRAILDIHQKLLHETPADSKSDNYNYHCHLCTKKFKMRGSLMVHLRVAHYGFVHKNNPCSTTAVDPDTSTSDLQKDTNLKISINNQLQSNNKLHDNKQWECDVCSKMFTTKYFLKKHKRLHTGEMPYVCVQCNKSFTFQQSYHKHMLYHSSEKPHVCTECGRAFKELSTLHNHERIHSGERPFACETCGKCFRQRVSYLVHRRIHTGVMPYKCTACDKSFRYKVSQRSHKCPINPPGSVIKAPNLIEKLSLKFTNNAAIESENKISVTSTDDLIDDISVLTQNEHNINMIVNNVADQIKNNSCSQIFNTTNVPDCLTNCDTSRDKDKNSFFTNLNATLDSSLPNYLAATESPDFFSMVLSPLVPEVQSLCLSSTTNESKVETRETFQTINEECFKEMLYGPSK